MEPNGHHHHAHDHHGHAAPDPVHTHAHGHQHDRGWAALLGYVSNLPRMWTSPVSTAVVGQLSPQPGQTLVELGSGMGAATVVAARNGAHIVAVDPTPYMRRILGLRRRLHRAQDRITVVDGAAEAIPVASASADAVWSVNAMHHWTDMDRALAEVSRVLRPGGRALLVDEDMEDPAHPFHKHFMKRRSHHHQHVFDMIDVADVAERLARLRFVSARGAKQMVGGRPAKVVEGIKA